MSVNKVTETARQSIIRKSVDPLPSNPGRAGIRANEVKKAMFGFVTDKEDSLLEELNRVVDEINESFLEEDEKFKEHLEGKVDKVEGMGLSSNNFTDGLKSKLESLENYDDTLINSSLNNFKDLTNQSFESVNSQLSRIEEDKASKDFVNSSIETATATFKGTFKNIDTLKATQADKNDYAFYDHYVADNRTFDRYKHNGTQWEYEYSLNNSSFTDAQWKAINSGITEELKNQILTNVASINNLLNTVGDVQSSLELKADKEELSNYVTNEALEAKEYVDRTDLSTRAPNALVTDLTRRVGLLEDKDTTIVAKTNEANKFTKKQKIISNEIIGVSEGDKLPYIEFGEEALIDSSIVPAVNIFSYNSTSAKTQKFQDKDGVIALTTDIPSTYIKDASVTDDVLTIEKQDGSSFQFEGGGGGTKTIWEVWE